MVPATPTTAGADLWADLEAAAAGMSLDGDAGRSERATVESLMKDPVSGRVPPDPAARSARLQLARVHNGSSVARQARPRSPVTAA